MKKYETQQRKILLDYLGSHIDENISALSLVEYLSSFKISKSAVYRNLASLEESGQIRRTAKSGERTAYYQYVAGESCQGKIHISCIKCGKTSHISPEFADNIVKNLEKEDDFALDKSETVLYGLCKECKGL